MKTKTFSLAELSRMGKIESILGYNIVSSGTVKGKITNLIRDKYGRLSGVEMESADESTTKHAAIAYNKIDSVDEENKVVNADF